MNCKTYRTEKFPTCEKKKSKKKQKRQNQHIIKTNDIFKPTKIILDAIHRTNHTND